MMEGSEAGRVSEGLPRVNGLGNGTSDQDKEDQVCHDSTEEAEGCSQANDVAQLDSESIEATTSEGQTETQTEPNAQICSQAQVGGRELVTDASCDSSAVSMGHSRPLSNEALIAPVNTLDDVVESSPLVLEGTIETSLTLDVVKDPEAPTQYCKEPSSLSVAACPTEPSPSDDIGLVASPSTSSLQSTSKNSPTDSSTTSGISNGPSTPNSDTVSPLLASSPQTSANTSAPTHCSSSPYDTDCSRKLISEIQRALSQESLLDELESELLACQLPEGESGSDSPPVNGLPTDEEGCMAVFEECVQYKYTQQEKAIQR